MLDRDGWGGRVVVTKAEGNSGLFGRSIPFRQTTHRANLRRGDGVNFHIAGRNTVRPVATDVALAGETIVITEIVGGNLTVNSDEFVTIAEGGGVQGNVLVKSFGIFTVAGGATITGNIEGRLGGHIIVSDNGRVNGSVLGKSSITVDFFSTVNGNIEASGEGAVLQDCTILGNVKTEKASDFSFTIVDNCTIDGSIESSRNDGTLIFDSTLNGSIKSKNDDFVEITDNVVASEIFVSGSIDCIVDGNDADQINASGCTGTNP